MPIEKNINIIKEPDVFSVFLINPPARDVYSFHQLTPKHYDTTIGPIPVQEMDCKMPACLFKIKRWCIRQKRVLRTDDRHNDKFMTGDLIVLQKGRLLHAGFYTSMHPLGPFEAELYPLLKYKSTDTYGFMYTDHQYLHKDITKEVYKRHARQNIGNK